MITRIFRGFFALETGAFDMFHDSLKGREPSAEGLPQPMTLLKATFDGP